MVKFLISGEPFPDASRLYVHFGESETDVFSIELTEADLEDLKRRVEERLAMIKEMGQPPLSIISIPLIYYK